VQLLVLTPKTDLIFTDDNDQNKRNDDENKLRKDTASWGIFLDGGEYSNCSKYKQKKLVIHSNK